MNEKGWKRKFSLAAKKGEISVVMDKKADQYAAYFFTYAKPYLALRKGRVLEMGCGTGEIAAFLAEKGFEVYGLDFVEEMIEIAKTRHQSPRAHFSVSDIYRIPFPDEFFDMVLSLGVFQTVENAEKALEELKRVLKKDGLLVVRTLNKLSASSVLARNLVLYNPFELRDLLSQKGFHITKLRGVYIFPSFLAFLSFFLIRFSFIPFLAHSFYLEAKKVS